MTTRNGRSSAQKLPTDRLRGELQNLVGALGDRAMGSVRDKVGGVTDRLADYAEGSGGSSLTAAVTGARNLAEGKSPARALLGAGLSSVKDKAKNLLGGGKGGGGKKMKITNIEESIDIGVPVRVAYNQWTQFRDFPSFMKKVENIEQESDEKLHWKAQVFWSHRSWESTIMSQVPDEKIVWRSKGDKGYVDGAVTFHELAPNLTRVLLVLEYHPQGLFEHTGNLWRAQGRRARLELKHFRRHVMSNVVLHPDEVEGWRGTIEDGEVVKDHESAVKEEGENGRGKKRDSGESGNGEPRRRRSSRGENGGGEPRRRRASTGSRSSDAQDDSAEKRPARRRSTAASEGSASRSRSAGSRSASTRSRTGTTRSRASASRSADK